MQTDLEEALSNAKDGDDLLADLCHEAQRTITRLRAELAEAQTWRDAVDDAIATECIGTANSFPDAAAAVEALIEWVMKVAVDPAVSRPAADLRANAFEEAATEIEQLDGFNDAKRIIAQAIRAMIDKG